MSVCTEHYEECYDSSGSEKKELKRLSRKSKATDASFEDIYETLNLHIDENASNFLFHDALTESESKDLQKRYLDDDDDNDSNNQSSSIFFSPAIATRQLYKKFCTHVNWRKVHSTGARKSSKTGYICGSNCLKSHVHTYKQTPGFNKKFSSSSNNVINYDNDDENEKDENNGISLVTVRHRSSTFNSFSHLSRSKSRSSLESEDSLPYKTSLSNYTQLYKRSLFKKRQIQCLCVDLPTEMSRELNESQCKFEDDNTSCDFTVQEPESDESANSNVALRQSEIFSILSSNASGQTFATSPLFFEKSSLSPTGTGFLQKKYEKTDILSSECFDSKPCSIQGAHISKSENPYKDRKAKRLGNSSRKNQEPSCRELYLYYMNEYPILSVIPPFVFINAILYTIDIVIATSYNTMRFVFLWCIPFTFISMCSVFVSIIISLYIYPKIYVWIIPYEPLNYPVYFNYQPTAYELQNPIHFYTRETPPEYMSPLATQLNNFMNRDLPLGVKLTEMLSSKWTRSKESKSKSQRTKHKFVNEQPLNNCKVCEEDKLWNESNSCNESHFFTQKDQKQRGMDLNYEGFAGCNFNKTIHPWDDVAVGLVTFDNKTWNFQMNDIGPQHRCLLYHHLLAKKRPYDAETVLSSIFPRNYFKKKRYFSRSHEAKDPFYIKFIDIHRYYNIYLILSYSPYEYSTHLDSVAALAPLALLHPNDTRFKSFRPSRQTSHYSNIFYPTSFIAMFTLEMYNLNCSRIASVTRSHVLTPEKKGVLTKYFEYYVAGLWPIKNVQKHQVLLLENVLFESYQNTHLNRIKMTPAIPLYAAHLRLEPQYGIFSRFILRHSVVFFLFYIAMSIPLFTVVLTAYVFISYVNKVSSILNPQEKIPTLDNPQDRRSPLQCFGTTLSS